MNKWEKWAFCKCGEAFWAPSGKKHFISKVVCPKCGADKDGWIVRTARWVITSKLWNPLTWGNGYFEIKEQS